MLDLVTFARQCREDIADGPNPPPQPPANEAFDPEAVADLVFQLAALCARGLGVVKRPPASSLRTFSKFLVFGMYYIVLLCKQCKNPLLLTTKTDYESTVGFNKRDVHKVLRLVRVRLRRIEAQREVATQPLIQPHLGGDLRRYLELQ